MPSKSWRELATQPLRVLLSALEGPGQTVRQGGHSTHFISSTETPAPKPLDSEIDVFGLTDVGKRRKANEDHFLICSLHKQMAIHNTSLPDLEDTRLTSESMAFLGLVADGLGGHAAGEEASKLALETVASYITHTMQCYYTKDPTQEQHFREELQASAHRCHSSVLAKAAERPEHMGMATTLTVAMMVWPRLYIVQVGDSRCYHMRDGQLTQITRDQTMAQELVDRGLLPKEEADESRWSDQLSSAIGGPAATPILTRIRLKWGDVVLLCSDGLTKHVSDDQINDRLRSIKSAQGACRALVTDALDGGGSDNVTVIVGRTHPPQPA